MVGKLIVIEGIDGTGKSTQAKLLSEKLQKMGYDVVFGKEPTDGEFGKKIRAALTKGFKNPLEETMLFALDRMQDVQNNIAPALMKNKVVVLDRYYFSSMAYQGSKGIDSEQIREINEWFSPVPDLLIILDADPSVSVKRINRERDTFENVEYLNNVREIFLNETGKPNTVVIDAIGSQLEINAEIMRHVKHVLPDIKQTTLDYFSGKKSGQTTLEGFNAGRPLIMKPFSWVPLQMVDDHGNIIRDAEEELETLKMIITAYSKGVLSLNELLYSAGLEEIPGEDIPHALIELQHMCAIDELQKKLSDFEPKKQKTLGEFSVKIDADTSDMNKKPEMTAEKVAALNKAIGQLNDTIDNKSMSCKAEINAVATYDRPVSDNELNYHAKKINQAVENSIAGYDVRLKKYIDACKLAYEKNDNLNDEYQGKEFRVGEWYVDRDGVLRFIPNCKCRNN